MNGMMHGNDDPGDDTALSAPREAVIRCDLFLDIIAPEHAADMFEGLQDKEAYRYIRDEPPESVQALRARYEHLIEDAPTADDEVWLNWIVRRIADHAPMGYTQLTINGAEALIGYHIFPRFWRCGVGRAAVAQTIDAAFLYPSVTYVCAAIDTRNAASIALVRRLGFHFDRLVKDADFFKGQSSDEFEFVLPREEWTRQQALRRCAGYFGCPPTHTG